MKKTTYILLVVIFSAILVLSGCSSKGITGNENEVRISIFGQLTPASAVISKEDGALVVDPKKVTSLQISSPSNADLKTLKYFVNLKYLRIDNNMERKKYDTYDLSPLQDLPLVGLDISGFEAAKPISIKSLEPLGNIESLAILDLNHCQVTSVEDLAGLTGLSRLSITDGKDFRIEDLSTLSNLTKLGEITDEVIDSKKWKYGPYITEDEPLLGLMISNGNSEEEVAALEEAILKNKNGSGQDSTNDSTKNSTKNDDSDSYYFKQYSSHKPDNKYGALLTVMLEAFDKKGEPVWNYSWENLKPTELDVASEAVAYDGKVYIEVTGTLYCLDGKSGKKLWENSNDVGGGAVIYPYRGKIYLTSYYGNVLTCLDKDSGA
ncbi:MAG: PQQ-binding-like beta-propeller repeat protein, partial [Peptococcaceae bacterium]|nr:PQQ-binding-like beta-propeller repeat protein [Peptococcaceae bacterium]